MSILLPGPRVGPVSLIGRRKASFAGAYDAIPSIAAAYGMRRLRTAYTGPILRLRRDSDNTEQDIGYTTAGHLDTAAVASFVGAGSGYVVTWYDQSGNGYDAEQAAAASQPLYVASGQNSKPVIRWDGSDDALAIPTVGLPYGNAARTLILVVPIASNSGPWLGYGINTPLKKVEIFQNGTSHSLGFSGVARGATVSPKLSITVFPILCNTDDVLLYADSVASALATTTGSDGAVDTTQGGAFIGRNVANTTSLSGDIAEIVICNAALSDANRIAAETAANAYWSVY